jgi:lipopolysaccharide transport system ATP-binding protein
MEAPILVVEGLSKQYHIGQQGKGSLTQDLLAGAKALFTKVESVESSFFALQDVSFEVQRGDILGIVGRNGAGKSTLLRILSEVTPPTAGKVTFRGSLTSILDVGTGFHPDLSGRQNVFMSDAINGASRQETQDRFDEIVAFAGIERFIDMPVKHYSSGMYMRLAFSVAFHSHADILLLDEVLSVGDVEFRQKSAQKIKDIAASGTTVILVSHELQSIRNLSNKCMVLEGGKLSAFGPTQEIIDRYLAQYFDDFGIFYRSPSNPDQAVAETRMETEEVALTGITVNARGRDPQAPIYMEDDIEIHIDFCKKLDVGHIEVMMSLNNLESIVLSDSRVYHQNFEFATQPAGKYKLTATIPGNLLYTGTFYIDLAFGNLSALFLELPCIHRFKVELNTWETDAKWNTQGRQFYAMRPKLRWNLQVIGE